jgi:hypothetical protein
LKFHPTAFTGAFGSQYATMLSLISSSVGISTSCTAPSPQPSSGSTQTLGRRS